TIFREDVLADVEDTVELKIIEPTEKHAALKDKDFSAVIEVPHDFLLNTWQYIFLEEGEAGTWNIDYNQDNGSSSNKVDCFQISKANDATSICRRRRKRSRIIIRVD